MGEQADAMQWAATKAEQAVDALLQGRHRVAGITHRNTPPVARVSSCSLHATHLPACLTTCSPTHHPPPA